MQIIDVEEATRHFSKVVDAVVRGEEIIIAKAGVPVAKLVPVAPIKRKLRFGTLKGKMLMPDEFDAPLPDEIISLFEAS